ncbi:MAG: hypothetical protein EBQ92_06760 [Proteobacteria bacterium]|nr:hypothetical protein [Pseudomonadota bacterium]
MALVSLQFWKLAGFHFFYLGRIFFHNADSRKISCVPFFISNFSLKVHKSFFFIRFRRNHFPKIFIVTKTNFAHRLMEGHSKAVRHEDSQKGH